MWFILPHTWHCILPCGPHTSSIGVTAFQILWYRSSHPDPRKSPQLQIWPHHLGPIPLPSQVCVFLVGEQKIVGWCQIRKIWRWSTSLKPQSCTTAIATTDLCARALSWWNRTPFISFPGRSWNVYSTTFVSPELLIQWRFIWKETMYQERLNLMHARFHCHGTTPP